MEPLKLNVWHELFPPVYVVHFISCIGVWPFVPCAVNFTLDPGMEQATSVLPCDKVMEHAPW